MPTGSHYSSHWGIYVGILLPRFLKELHINIVCVELCCRMHYNSNLQDRVRCRTLFSHLSSLGHDNLESSLLCPRKKKRKSWSEFSICHSLQYFLNLKWSPQIKLKSGFWKQCLQGCGLPGETTVTWKTYSFLQIAGNCYPLNACNTLSFQNWHNAEENMLKHLRE